MRILNLADGYTSATSPTTTPVSTTAAVVSYVNTTSGLVAENAQDALDEIDGRLDVAEADVTSLEGRVLAVENLGPMSYRGTWNASTNTPSLATGVGTKGYAYRVSVAGSTTLDGISSWAVGDFAVYNGTAWDKWDTTDQVTSINGQGGVVVLGADDIAESSIRFWGKKNNLTAVTAPVVGDDSGDGYSAGSMWYDQTGDTLYVCEDATLGAAVWQGISGAGGGSGGGSKNYITNGDAETDTSGWSTYADAAGVMPVDLTGGAANITWARNTTTPLSGTGDFLLTKDAVNRQGQGASCDFTIDLADRARILTIRGDFTTSANFATGDLRVYIYDVTSAMVIEPSAVEISASTQGRLHVQFQSSSNSVSYRLGLHVASTSALAYTVNFDSITLGPAEVSKGALITDWVAWTPTGSWSTNATYTGWKRQVGGEAEYKVNIALAGVPTSADLTINLPSGEVIDAPKTFTNGASGNAVKSIIPFSGGSYLDAGNNAYPLTVGYNNTTSVAVFSNLASSTYLVSTTTTYQVDQAIPIAGGSGDTVEVFFRVPIAGWGSGQIHSSDAGSRTISFKAQKNAAQAVASTAATTVVYDTLSGNGTHESIGGMFNTSTGVFTVPEAGYYFFHASARLSSLASETFAFRIVQSGTAIGLQSHTTDGGALADVRTSAQAYCVKGDTIHVEVDSGADASYQVDGTSATFFHGFKIPSAQQISAAAVVAASYTTNAGQSIASGLVTPVTVVFEDVVKDTHQGMNTSTGEYTVPMAGDYSVKARIVFSGSTNWTIGEQMYLSVHVNGTVKGQQVFSFPATSASSIQMGIQCFYDAPFNKGDIITIRALQNSGAALTLDNNGALNQVSIHRIGGVS